MMAKGKPKVVTRSMTHLATVVAFLSGQGYATGHFENRSTTVKMYWFPLLVWANGPIKSIPKTSQTLDV